MCTVQAGQRRYPHRQTFWWANWPRCEIRGPGPNRGEILGELQTARIQVGVPRSAGGSVSQLGVVNRALLQADRSYQSGAIHLTNLHIDAQTIIIGESGIYVRCRVVLDSFFRADSTLTHMTIQVTQLRLNSNSKFANLTQLRLNSKPKFTNLTQL